MASCLCRGVNHQTIFRDDRDREHFLGLLEEFVQRYGVRLHAFVLMDTHYHLEVGTPESNLSRAMQWLHLSTGLTLRELGAAVGGMDFAAVSVAVQRQHVRVQTDATLAAQEQAAVRLLTVEMSP